MKLFGRLSLAKNTDALSPTTPSPAVGAQKSVHYYLAAKFVKCGLFTSPHFRDGALKQHGRK